MIRATETNLNTPTEYDVIVVGSGGAGMTAAAVAANEGLTVLLLEKEAFYGGTTALSGGGIWIPNNHHMQSVGEKDSFEEALRYLDETVGEQSSPEKKHAFLTHAPKMLSYMEAHTQLQMIPYDKYPDYYPDKPGARLRGRSLEPVAFDGKQLNGHFYALRPPMREGMIMGGMMVGTSDIKHLLSAGKSWQSLRYVLKLVMGHLLDIGGRRKYRRGTRLVMGNAMIARLRMTLENLKVPVWLETSVDKLLISANRIQGVEITHHGQRQTLIAKKGVVLASGGFPGNQSLREKWLPKPTYSGWTVAPTSNTGDGITMATESGAAISNQQAAWWMPTSLMRRDDGSISRFPHVIDRAKPGVIAVNKAGERFTNEAASYLDFVKDMLKANEATASVPAYLIADANTVNKFGLGLCLPVLSSKKELINKGYLYKGATLTELAHQLDIDADGLEMTAERYSEFAVKGVDKDFAKGSNEYDRHYGDPDCKPNPCLKPLTKGPFYAVKIYPGDIGTICGLQTNEYAQVMDKKGHVLEGLYAAGNDHASVMGNTYPGAGSTLGPGLTFAYVAARHMAQTLEN